MNDLYKEHKRTSGTATIKVKTFEIDGIPVCQSWYGCEKHKRESCQFLLVRRYGTIKVCGLTGEDLPDIPDTINRVPDNCPLRRGKSTVAPASDGRRGLKHVSCILCHYRKEGACDGNVSGKCPKWILPDDFE